MKGIDKIIRDRNKMTHVQYQRDYCGVWFDADGTHDDNPFPPPRIGQPVYYNDKGQLVYEDGERVINNE